MTTPLRTSPAYDAHSAAGAVFREKSGWHRVDYLATNESRGDSDRAPLGPSRALWSPAIEAEHRATRRTVGLFDLTSFGKIEVSGPGAGALLESVCANIVSREQGRLTYTQMLNAYGGVVSDVTVGRVDEDTFVVVTGTSSLIHDLAWIRSHAAVMLRAGSDYVTVRDITSAWCCFGLWGPLARDALAPLINRPLDSADFPYMSMREARIGDVPVRMSRVTFVGELGWEIYAPTEFGRGLWQVLSAAANHCGGLRCGYRAIDSLRAEKGYLYLGADITSDRTPHASGLSAFVSQQKAFVGREALDAAGQPSERLACFTLDGAWYLLQGGENVHLADGFTGRVTSAGLGYTVGASIGFAFLPSDLLPGTSLAVEVDHEFLPATLVSQPLYDPDGRRIRA
jgi:glycine cleavage system aminomethyltransferase T